MGRGRASPHNYGMHDDPELKTSRPLSNSDGMVSNRIDAGRVRRCTQPAEHRDRYCLSATRKKTLACWILHSPLVERMPVGESQARFE